MYIQTLQVFCNLAESGSFSKAAQLSGISQSAVSQQVRALEKELGVQLVDRRRSGLTLSAEGQVFLESCRAILSIYAQIPGRLASVDSDAVGEIRVASVSSIGLYELPGRLSAFRESHPGITVLVDYKRASQVYAAVLDGSADLGLVAFPSRRTGLHMEVFDEDELVLILPPEHPGALREEVRIQDLEGERLIAFEPDIPTRKAVDKYLKSFGLKWKPYLEFDGVEMVKRAVKVEGGVAIVPRKTVTKETASGELVVRELRNPSLCRPLGMIFRRGGARPPAWKSLLEALRRKRNSAGGG